MTKSAQGFTFVELMVTITIGMILVAGGLAAYRGAGEREELKQAGFSFQTNLKSFQQKALSGEKPAGCLGTLEDFRVQADAGLTSYSVMAECSTVDGPETDFELITGVEFSAEFSDIVFYTLESTLDGAQTIDLITDSGEYTYQLTIESTGVIRGEML